MLIYSIRTVYFLCVLRIYPVTVNKFKVTLNVEKFFILEFSSHIVDKEKSIETIIYIKFTGLHTPPHIYISFF